MARNTIRNYANESNLSLDNDDKLEELSDEITNNNNALEHYFNNIERSVDTIAALEYLREFRLSIGSEAVIEPKLLDLYGQALVTGTGLESSTFTHSNQSIPALEEKLAKGHFSILKNIKIAFKGLIDNTRLSWRWFDMSLMKLHSLEQTVKATSIDKVTIAVGGKKRFLYGANQLPKDSKVYLSEYTKYTAFQKQLIDLIYPLVKNNLLNGLASIISITDIINAKKLFQKNMFVIFSLFKSLHKLPSMKLDRTETEDPSLPTLEIYMSANMLGYYSLVVVSPQSLNADIDELENKHHMQVDLTYAIRIDQELDNDTVPNNNETIVVTKEDALKLIQQAIILAEANKWLNSYVSRISMMDSGITKFLGTVSLFVGGILLLFTYNFRVMLTLARLVRSVTGSNFFHVKQQINSVISIARKF